MTTSAQIIAHSTSWGCPDLVTFQLRYPLFVHAEFMTHRAFSRNASSARAIPTERIIADIIADTAMPAVWHYDQSGMQGTVDMSPGEAAGCEDEWLDARDDAIDHVKWMLNYRPHKQTINRLLAPFMHINVVASTTTRGLDNFLALRDHADADPTIRALAREMRVALSTSKPRDIGSLEWHLPYVSDDELREYGLETAKMISVARCASVSYKTVDGKIMTVDRARALWDKLANGDPFHASPFEHVAKPWPSGDVSMCRNFDRWAQLRAFMGG
jgi:thymidylate synthase ThyX